jgi:hypothetical protein
MCTDGSPDPPDRIWSGAEERVSHRNVGDGHLALIEGLKTQSANARAEMDAEVDTVTLHSGIAQVRSRHSSNSFGSYRPRDAPTSTSIVLT